MEKLITLRLSTPDSIANITEYLLEILEKNLLKSWHNEKFLDLLDLENLIKTNMYYK